MEVLDRSPKENEQTTEKTEHEYILNYMNKGSREARTYAELDVQLVIQQKMGQRLHEQGSYELAGKLLDVERPLSRPLWYERTEANHTCDPTHSALLRRVYRGGRISVDEVNIRPKTIGEEDGICSAPILVATNKARLSLVNKRYFADQYFMKK